MNFTLFAERLREARKKSGLSQAELAQRCDIAVSTLSSYEKATGEKGATPKLDIAVKLADALDVSLDWLCERSSSETAVSSSRAFTKKLVELVNDDALRVTWDGSTYCFYDGALLNRDSYNLFCRNLDELHENIEKLENAGLNAELLKKVKEDLVRSLYDEGEELFDTTLPF